ncbi:hypothetical protein QEZ54_09995 [Catellatospora sp. KI3]|uniref:hypothetical protein n=1 Tax=Catellatospora sp. KI3 TaxID=3041620 RepID=UPI002482270F|nr:hypothetical protein [Catellatospora sp. KI3]MDI1461298.1 hypothetical protein [Catellatospora sp. KI3]
MHLVKMRLVGVAPDRTLVDSAVVSDLIWAHALAQDGVEHVVTRVEPDSMTVVLFIRTAHETHARVIAAELMKRAAAAPAMRGWQISP